MLAQKSRPAKIMIINKEAASEMGTAAETADCSDIATISTTIDTRMSRITNTNTINRANISTSPIY